ncbi:LPXTG cell wall anchor domain-containing protein [Bifidobacterium sp. 82T10]|uniref:LPXTG cell wall anchor domain-containing protein n=1 Tax=Bifidobacterium miconis TaxID=2834435 RepID=A0ABS6WGG5_9BIFI|nr:SpaA isopeptide-forming pilin-related protein [Bifidobacterium miconis]MBW3092674.1 LPXTG cell wall anchor domain-containing protein [Bifidobacterium miconis]
MAMKQWGKALPGIMAAASMLLFGLGAPLAANADDGAATPTANGDYTITIENTTPGYTYTAYQVFSGTLSKSGVLSDIQWGKNIATAAQGVMSDDDRDNAKSTIIDELKTDSAFNVNGVNVFASYNPNNAATAPGVTTAAEVAKVLGLNFAEVGGGTSNNGNDESSGNGAGKTDGSVTDGDKNTANESTTGDAADDKTDTSNDNASGDAASADDSNATAGMTGDAASDSGENGSTAVDDTTGDASAKDETGSASTDEKTDGAASESSSANGSAANGLSAAAKEAAVHEFAKIVGNHLDEAGAWTSTPSEGKYTITVPAGYYLIRNKGNASSIPGSEGASGTDYILKVAGNVSVKPKGTVPTVTKKVKDTDDSIGSSASTGWQDSADHDYYEHDHEHDHEPINYRLDGTLPTTYDSYGWYKYSFRDTMSKGLTLHSGKPDKSDDQTASNDAASTTDDAKTDSGTTVTPKYDVHVYAVTGTAYGDGTLTCTGDTTGKCTEIKNVTGATADADKATGYVVDYQDYKSTAATDGATSDKTTTDEYAGGHVLTVSFTDLKQIVDTNGSKITLDKDSHVIVEYTVELNTGAHIGYEGNPNKVDLTYSNNPTQGGEGDTGTTPEDQVIVFTFRITVNKTDENNKAKPGATFELSKYDATKKDYVPVQTIESGDKDFCADGATFTFNGLDAGRYRLEETNPPTNYNKWGGLDFWIVAEHDTESDNPKLTSLNFYNLGENGQADKSSKITKFSVDSRTDPDDKDKTEYAGTASITVQNVRGSTLPKSGGMGTAALYVAGVACVIAAVAWFAVRRRTKR